VGEGSEQMRTTTFTDQIDPQNLAGFFPKKAKRLSEKSREHPLLCKYLTNSDQFHKLSAS
jgi:hypothetical protein